MSIRVIVCAKQVPDPEGPPASFEVDENEMRVTTRGISPVINPFDENALEAAVRIKESVGARITLLSMGRKLSEAVLLKAMAVGADEAVLLEGEEFDAGVLDSCATAMFLSAAVKKIGDFDLILTGRQASDTNSGQVGLGLSCLLGIPAVNLARKIEVSGNIAVVQRVLRDGYEIVEAGLPLLVTVSGELGDLRYPSMQAIKAARQLPRNVLTFKDLDIETQLSGTVQTAGLASPSRERNCAFIEGETPEEAGIMLAEKLREDRVI